MTAATPHRGQSSPNQIHATAEVALRPGYLRRPRLVERLQTSSLGPLTVLCAPAGAGKTSLLAAWAATEERRLVWIPSEPGTGPLVRRVLDAFAPARPRTAVEPSADALVDELAAFQDDVVIVLDDYDGAELWSLIPLLPEAGHVVVASRRDPPLRLALRRARGEVAELRL